MDEVVLRSMARWPNVPAVYGWLALDRRGRWRIRGEILEHPGAIEFIGRNYAADEQGCWYFQNGPQRVYVALDLTPWVLRLLPDGLLETHTGMRVDAPVGAYLDEQGNVYIDTEHGIGLVEDRDLEALSERLTDANGRPLDADAAIATLDGVAPPDTLSLRLPEHRLSLQRIALHDLPSRFGFEPEPIDPNAH